MRRFRILPGDVLDVLPSLPADSFDACLCDPPYGLSFMGRAWDHGVPGAAVWAGVLATLKPGAPLLAFGGTRTFHRLTCAIEDAGFEIRDCLAWLYGSGFPKSLDVSKAIDKAAGAEREVVGVIADRWTGRGTALNFATDRPQAEVSVTGAPATPAAARWFGYGTALKPAWEPCILAMKPLAGTFASNALEHGVAGLNVDGCRIATGDALGGGAENAANHRGAEWRRAGSAEEKAARTREAVARAETLGRWPANVALDEAAAAMLDEATGELTSGSRAAGEYGRLGGHGRLGEWSNGPMPAIDGDSGGASRFFYTAKADLSERRIGGVDCRHPTLKPIDLTAWLARLILPPPREDGSPRRLLVPFSGAGSEVIGALRAGWDEVVGIEREAEYVELSRRRIVGDAPLLNTEAA